MAKYRISVSENGSIGSTFLSPIDVDNFIDFLNYLRKENVKTFNLKYRSIMDDFPCFKEMGISIADFKQEDFEWLVEKSKWQSKSLEIVTRIKNTL